MNLAWYRGVIAPVDETRIPLRDRGHLLGDGLFETMRVVQGSVANRSAHRDRFADGARVLGIRDEVGDHFDQAVTDLSRAAKRHDGPLRLRVQATTGDMAGVLGDGRPRVTGLLTVPHDPPTQLTLHTATYRKQHDDPLRMVKHLSFLPHLHAKRQAVAAGADDALLLNDLGRPTELSTSNLFAVVGKTVYAPGAEEGALAGVTRANVIKALAAQGMAIKERLDADAMRQATEAWATNTIQGVVPIVAVDGRPVGSGRPGPTAEGLRRHFQEGRL